MLNLPQLARTLLYMLSSWLICVHGSMAQTSIQQACIGDEVAFPTQINPNLSGIVDWHWDFGDPQSGSSNVSKKLNPTHIFQEAGTYQVQLIIETMAGLIDSIQTQVEIFPAPTLVIDRLSPCDGDSLVLAMERGNIPLQAQWRWGMDGQSAEGLLANISFPKPGTYPIKVSARNRFGCVADTFWNQVWPLIPPAPKVLGTKILCKGASLELETKIDPRYELRWSVTEEVPQANFEGNIFHVPSVNQDLIFTFFYQEPRFSCKSAPLIHQVRVQSAAKLKVSHRYLTPELLPARIEFQLNSPIPLSSVRWDFGSEQYSSLSKPTHTFYTPGEYEVKVSVQDQLGCEWKKTHTLVVSPPPLVAFPSAFSPNGDGVNDVFALEQFNLQDFTLQVFDPSGRVVFEAREPGFRWQGTSPTGTPLPEGVYSFVIQGQVDSGEPFTQRGNVMLLR